MVLWLALRIVAWVIFGVGIILFVVQLIHNKAQGLAIIINIIGLSTIIITFFGCRYYAPTYAGVTIDHNEAQLIQKAVKDERLLLAVNSNSSDTDACSGQEAAINLNTLVMRIHKTPKDCELCKVINKSLIFDIQFPIINSHDLRHLVIYSNHIISNSIVQKQGSTRNGKQIFDQMNKDAGIVR